MPLSIVRENLLTVAGYTPYCGAGNDCPFLAPRTQYDGEQFTCRCGWRSKFPDDFLAEYRAKWFQDGGPTG